ncbi:hypothetical protein B0T17DRAFT_635687 [Bombardia bombarda]|uniref:RBR-type E3 ubiquitin transferase n=1 Tax=Bombardia bombarda TaxID=252184 RepID=A0AA39XB87_9PEZI|nr:hypothetical protein B0T17DRAFT_635687 [Bombardia bombarda]
MATVAMTPAQQVPAITTTTPDPSPSPTDSKSASKRKFVAATVSIEDEDQEEVDLSQYPPPETLNNIPGNNPEPIRLVAKAALRNIIEQVAVEKSRIEEEAAARLLVEEEEEEEEEEARKDKGKAKAEDTDSSASWHDALEAQTREQEQPTQQGLEPDKATTTTNTPKRSRFGLWRILHHIVEKGESSGSASGSSNETAVAESLHIHKVSSAGASSSGSDPDAVASGTFTQFYHKHLRSTSDADGTVETVECVSCLDDDVPSKDSIKLPCHHYCKPCFRRLITTALENEAQWPPKCCLTPIPYRTTAKNIAGDLLKQYKKKDEEFKIPVENRIYCSEPDCGEWIRKVDKARKRARCSRGHTMCVMCRQPPHPGDSACPRDLDQQLADRLAGEEGWRRCISCTVLVEHREACQHMTCRCGAQFCYVCGLLWRTCACTMEQLAAIKTAAAARRAEREARQAEEDAWLRAALEQIERLEAEDRRREEEARAAEEARLEELRRREERVRVRREEERRAEMERKYQELWGALVELDDVQRFMLGYEQDGERERRVAKGVRKVEELGRRQEREWEREARIRTGREKQLEEGYAKALNVFWAGKPGGRERVDMALKAYMEKNDARLDVWEKMKDDDLTKVRYLEEDELAVREELMEAMRKRQEDAMAAEEEEMRRRHVAETRWFDLVVAERTRLLAEMETVERESGEGAG